MKISTVNYFIGDAFKSFKRNKTISIATIITVLVTFIVLGTFSLVAENLNLAIGGLEDKIELVVYLNDIISFDLMKNGLVYLFIFMFLHMEENT